MIEDLELEHAHIGRLAVPRKRRVRPRRIEGLLHPPRALARAVRGELHKRVGRAALISREQPGRAQEPHRERAAVVRGPVPAGSARVGIPILLLVLPQLGRHVEVGRQVGRNGAVEGLAPRRAPRPDMPHRGGLQPFQSLGHAPRRLGRRRRHEGGTELDGALRGERNGRRIHLERRREGGCEVDLRVPERVVFANPIVVEHLQAERRACEPLARARSHGQLKLLVPLGIQRPDDRARAPLLPTESELRVRIG